MNGVHIGLFASLLFAGWVASLCFVPRLADIYGRKWIIIWSVLLKVLITQGMFLVRNIPLAYTFFFIYGFTLGGSISVAYVYLMELLPKDWRPVFGGVLNGIEAGIGIFTALISMYFHTISYLYVAESGWVLLVIGFVLVFYLPESPVFLIRNG